VAPTTAGRTWPEPADSPSSVAETDSYTTCVDVPCAAALRGVRPRGDAGLTARSLAVEVVAGERVEKEGLAALYSAMCLCGRWPIQSPPLSTALEF
jgi:hypothetical protein